MILPVLFLVIIIYGSGEDRIRSSFLFFLYTLAGSLFMLLAILQIYNYVGSTDLQLLSLSEISLESQIILFLAFFLALAVKTPLVPFHMWLPRAHTSAPLGGSILLAGKPVPALNLAICWEHLKRSISRKLFAYTSNFNNILREDNILKLENIKAINDCESNIKLDRILRGHTLNATIISSYLAGLIEGDGNIYVPQTGAASVTIIFNSKDLPLALLIQKEINHGNIYKIKGKNAYSYVISNLLGLTIIVNHINGHFRTHKINSLFKLIDWINFKNNNSNIIDKLPLDNSCLSENAWLAGFIESDGCFYIRVTKNKNCTTSKVACYFELAQKTTEDKSMLDIMTKISEFLSCNLKFKKSNQYWVRTSSYNSNKILVSYLSKFPIFGSKYLDYLSWQKVLNIMIKKEQTKKLEEINNIKNNMNSKRTYLNWDHLKNFYS